MDIGRFHQKKLVFFMCCLTFVACGDENDTEAKGGEGCDINSSQICTCEDGSSGNMTCVDGIKFSGCQCDSQSEATTGEPEAITGEPAAGNGAPNMVDGGVGDGGTQTVNTASPMDGGRTGDGGTSTDPNNGNTGNGNTGASPVSIEDLPCGPLQGVNSPPVNIGGRDVLINYPCNTESNTPVTFILNLHGTQADEGLKFYQHAYLGAYEYVTTHNFIVASPKSVVSQWGNGDGGQDRPHIMEVIDWVYQTFTDFDIVSMWVAGHSWGAMYARTLVCELEQTRGVILQSGGAQMPTCADRLSVIATVGENDIVPGQPEQTATASSHGCDASNVFSLGNNEVTEWPNCDPGWSHKNYMLLGKGHGFVPTDWPDKGITEDIANAIRDAM